ncbi:hypothetical protein [Rhodoflexus caldus]|uniref:hypothetical protein n=1 Tax=Rhodoflexus caldus TaxID=2891236 RepID=UPI00202A40D7|nr:hypothetical protein [Rhodoflexus caldus]
MLKAAFRLIVNACFAIVRRVLLTAAGGAAVNWLFAVVLFVALSGWTFAKVALVAIVFLLGFPVAWLLLGKTYGLRQGIYELATTHKIALFEYLIYQLTVIAQAKTLDNPKMQQGLLQSRQWLAQMPAPVRWVISGLANYLPLNEILQEVIQNQKLTEENLIAISRLAAQKLDTRTNIGLLQPSPRPLQVLAAFNLAAMVLAGVLA